MYVQYLACLIKNHIEKNFSFESVINKAQALASTPFVAPNSYLPGELLNLSYDQHRDIRFIRENGPWYNQNLPYEIQFFQIELNIQVVWDMHRKTPIENH